MVEQLALTGLQLRDDAAFSNYFVGDNAAALSCLKQAMSGQGERLIYLWGAAETGRTHLLQACCHDAQDYQRRAAYFPLQDIVGLSPEMLTDMDQLDVVCLDDIQTIAGVRRWEEAVFGLYNAILDGDQTCLIISADCPPRQLALQLPDLQSRLSACVVFQLQPLSDADKVAALLLRARMRGLALPEETAQFLLSRCPRNLHALFAFLHQLDRASLAKQRRLTIPFVKDVLNIDSA